MVRVSSQLFGSQVVVIRRSPLQVVSRPSSYWVTSRSAPS
jgi:hypothetical protein